jgi:hypothetical protein
MGLEAQDGLLADQQGDELSQPIDREELFGVLLGATGDDGEGVVLRQVGEQRSHTGDEREDGESIPREPAPDGGEPLLPVDTTQETGEFVERDVTVDDHLAGQGASALLAQEGEARGDTADDPIAHIDQRAIEVEEPAFYRLEGDSSCHGAPF